MPIEFRCTQCQKLLRTPDGSSGREAKCPQCGAIVKIPEPAAAAHSASTPPVPPLDNPYASPPRLSPEMASRSVATAFQPTRIEVGDVLSRTWEIFKLRWLSCAAATWSVPLIVAGVCAPFILVVVFTAINNEHDAASIVAASLLLAAVAIFASVWMALGIHAFMLKVARGEEVSARDLLGETSLLVPALLATVLVGGAVMLGFGLLIVPGVILSLMFSQFINVMVDRQVGAIESLRLSIQATEGNKVTLLLLALLMWAVNTAAATLTCGLSTFVVAPFISLMGSVAYLAMTGQTMAYAPEVERERPLGSGA
jgi:phage FluMu protein Com